MTFSVTVLGSSGTFPAPDTACSGYLLRTDTTAVWLDCGSGTLANLQRHVGLDVLDGVVCSHEHPDHWTDLLLADNALRYVLDRPEGAVPLYWTAGTAARFAVVAGRGPEGPFAPAVIDETTNVSIGDIDFRFSRTDHPVETLAVRAESGGRVLGYSADTADGWDLASLLGDDGAHLAVIEASVGEIPDGGLPHLTGRQAGGQAARAGVTSLLLTHLVPGSDPERRAAEAAEHFGGPIAVAESNATYPI